MSKREANRQYRTDKSRLDKLARSQQRRGMNDAKNKAYQHQNAQVAASARKASWWFK